MKKNWLHYQEGSFQRRTATRISHTELATACDYLIRRIVIFLSVKYLRRMHFYPKVAIFYRLSDKMCPKPLKLTCIWWCYAPWNLLRTNKKSTIQKQHPIVRLFLSFFSLLFVFFLCNCVVIRKKWTASSMEVILWKTSWIRLLLSVNHVRSLAS